MTNPTNDLCYQRRLRSDFAQFVNADFHFFVLVWFGLISVLRPFNTF